MLVFNVKQFFLKLNDFENYYTPFLSGFLLCSGVLLLSLLPMLRTVVGPWATTPGSCDNFKTISNIFRRNLFHKRKILLSVCELFLLICERKLAASTAKRPEKITKSTCFSVDVECSLVELFFRLSLNLFFPKIFKKNFVHNSFLDR